MRSMVKATSSAVNALPLWNVAPWTRLQRQRHAVVGEFPRFRQRGDVVPLLVGFDECFEDRVTQRGGVGGQGRDVRIEHLHLGRHPDVQRAARYRRLTRGRRRLERQRAMAHRFGEGRDTGAGAAGQGVFEEVAPGRAGRWIGSKLGSRSSLMSAFPASRSNASERQIAPLRSSQDTSFVAQCRSIRVSAGSGRARSSRDERDQVVGRPLEHLTPLLGGPLARLAGDAGRGETAPPVLAEVDAGCRWRGPSAGSAPARNPSRRRCASLAHPLGIEVAHDRRFQLAGVRHSAGRRPIRESRGRCRPARSRAARRRAHRCAR